VGTGVREPTYKAATPLPIQESAVVEERKTMQRVSSADIVAGVRKLRESIQP